MPLTPVIVVGLGGTGMKALLQLKRMIVEGRPGGMSELPALRLLCIDSDDLIRPADSAAPGVAQDALGLDPHSEFLKLEIPGNVGFEDLDRARTWFPRELEYYIPDLATGCKQYKALGRLLFAWNHAKVARLIEPLRGMVDTGLLKRLGVTQVDDPLVFVVGSLCGGTGAGMFLDVGYLLTNLWKRKWTRFNTKVCALLAMPSVFSDLTHGTERIRSNAYASLKELDHFMSKDVYTDPERAFRNDYPYVEHPETLGMAPFDRVFLFDNGNGRVSVSSAQVYEMMARYMYLMCSGELTQDYLSVDNNLNPKVRGTHRLLNKPTCYSSFGYYSVVFPRRKALQLAAADLGGALCEEELASKSDEAQADAQVDAFLTANKLHFSPQSPQILHALSFYNDSTGRRANIQDVIGSTVANIELEGEAPESYEAAVREFDTRFTNSELHLFEADCRREAQALLKAVRTNLEAEIQKLADPARSGSVKQVAQFLEELAKELQDDTQALETLLQQAEKQLPGLKSALDTQYLKLRQTGASRSLFTRMSVRRTLAELLQETRETLENYWLARRKALVLRQALALLKGDAAAPEEAARTGVLATALRERQAYRAKLQALERTKEQLHELRHKRLIPDGEFYRVAFAFDRDVRPLIDELRQRRGGLAEARRLLHADECLGNDLDGLIELPLAEAQERLLRLCETLFAPSFDGFSLEQHLAALGDVRAQVKTWLNCSRPFVVLDSADSSKYGFSEEHNAARFIALPDTYAGKPCEQMPSRCPAASLADCDRFDGCLKRTVLEALPRGTSLCYVRGRHEMHFLSLCHGFAASSLIQLISDGAAVYRNHLLASERIHMFGPLKLYDLREPSPNKALERLKDLFYVGFAQGSVAWEEGQEQFLFKTDADLELELQPSVVLGSDIGAILDNYHSPQAAAARAVGDAFACLERRIAERCQADARGLGRELLAFVRAESVALDDHEKRRIYGLGQDLAEGRCSSI